MNKIITSSIVVLLLIPAGFNAVSAKTWLVEIPTGAADPNAPLFYDPWELSMEVGDEAVWQNGDSAAHTVTSGTPETGRDGRFDSDLFGPGKIFSYRFLEKDAGVVKYYCIVHPFMTGTINVGPIEEGFQVLHNVGEDVGKTTFDVEYSLSRSLAGAQVDMNQNSITFTLAGVIEDDQLILKLPEGLIKNPHSVWLDEQQIMNFESNFADGVTTMKIPLQAESESVTIVGSSVIPEFGSIAALILALAIIGTIVVSVKGVSLRQHSDPIFSGIRILC